MNGKVLKLHKWWKSHFGTMMTFIYLVLIISPSPPSLSVFLQTLAIFTIASLGIGTFGQLLNDLTDVDQDIRSGAQNLVARKGVTARLILFAVVLVVAILPWWWLPTSPAILTLLAGEFMLFALYSIPPFRLKNRGILGPIDDALYGYVIPNIVAVLVFAQLGGGFPPWLVFVMALWAFLFGLDHIVQHQLIDESRDRVDGVKTFVVTGGWDAAFDFLHWIAVPLEALSFVALLVSVGLFAPLIPMFFTIYLVLLLSVWVRLSLWNTIKLTSLPLIDRVHVVSGLVIAKFVWRWLPLLSLAALVSMRSEFLLIVPLHLALFPEPLVWLRREGFSGVRVLLSGKRGPIQ